MPDLLIDLRPDHLKIVLDILARHVPDREVWAFGSRATWKTKDFSDLDLAVIGEEPLPLKISAALSDDFAESDLPFKVDVVDWATTSESFREIIRRDRVVVCGLNRWRPSTWGEEISLEYGKGIRNYSTTSGKYPVFGANGRIGWGDSYLVSGPGVILGRKGAYRGVRYCECPFFVIDTAYYVLSKREHDYRWLYYAIKHHRLGEIDDGSPIPSTTRAAVYVRPLDVPPKGEQTAIAAILGALDDKIDLNRRMNETLEAMARALFKSWFVDFDPVCAKMEGRKPEGRGAATANLFPAEMAENDIPMGWMVSAIGAEVRVVGGSTPSTKEPAYWANGCHHWVTPKDLSGLSSPVLLDSERKLTDAGLAQIGSGLLPVGSVLLSSRAPIGYLAMTEVPAAINQGFIGMICNSLLPKQYVYEWCRQNLDLIKSHANGSTFLEINKAAFRPLPVVVPSAPVLAAYRAQSDPLYLKMVANIRQSRTLSTLRDLLLPRLLSGQLRIKDAEKMVAEAI